MPAETWRVYGAGYGLRAAQALRTCANARVQVIVTRTDKYARLVESAGFTHSLADRNAHPSDENAFVAVPDACLPDLLSSLPRAEGRIFAEVSDPFNYLDLKQRFPHVRFGNTFLMRPPIAKFLSCCAEEFRYLSNMHICVTRRTLPAVLWFLIFGETDVLSDIRSSSTHWKAALGNVALTVQIIQLFDDADDLSASPNAFSGGAYGKGRFLGLQSPNGPFLSISKDAAMAIRVSLGATDLAADNYERVTERNIAAAIQTFTRRGNCRPALAWNPKPNARNLAHIVEFFGRGRERHSS